jgi:ABC-type Zn uptake system ZnuABC Zn-binding protein ZnuA
VIKFDDSEKVDAQLVKNTDILSSESTKALSDIDKVATQLAKSTCLLPRLEKMPSGVAHTPSTSEVSFKDLSKVNAKVKFNKVEEEVTEENATLKTAGKMRAKAKMETIVEGTEKAVKATDGLEETCDEVPKFRPLFPGPCKLISIVNYLRVRQTT